MVGNTVVIAGGVGDNNRILSSTTLLNISSQSQKPGGNMSSARFGFQLLKREDQLLAIGGERQDLPVLNIVKEWDPTLEVWTTSEDLNMTKPRLWFGAVSGPRSAVCAANQ